MHTPLAQQSFWRLIPHTYLHMCELTHDKVLRCINVYNGKSMGTTKYPPAEVWVVSWGTYTPRITSNCGDK